VTLLAVSVDIFMNLWTSPRPSTHFDSGVTRVFGTRGQTQWSASPPPESRHVGLTPTAQHSDLRLRNLRHWQLAHAADFIKLTFVVVSHTIFLVRLFLLHLAYCAPGQLLPSAALVMPLHDENHCWGVLCVRNPVLTEVTVCQRNNIGPGFTVNPNLLTL